MGVKPTPAADSGGHNALADFTLHLDHVQAAIGSAQILHDISLRIEPGMIYGLLGPNGAGKSTTLAVAIGLLAHNGGTVALFGRDPARSDASLRAAVGMLPEQNGFYDWMTGESYLRFFAGLYGRGATRADIGERLKNVGLEADGGRTIASYSRGTRQRLGLARALIGRPRLLLLDEPTNGLDPRGRRDIHDVLIGLARNGVSILLCTHLLDDVERLCERIGIIVHGRTVADGTIEALLASNQQGLRFRLRLSGPLPDDARSAGVTLSEREGDWVVVECDPARRPDETWRELLFRAWPIVEIERVGGGLEALYLDLTSREHDGH